MAFDSGRRLEPRGGVHDIAGGHSLASGRLGVERDERLTGCDADPDLEVSPSMGPSADGEGSSHGPLGIVLVGDRRTEQRHGGVADELLDRPAVALELGADALVVAAEHGSHVLGIHPLGTLGGPDQVAEEDGDDLPLLACARGGGRYFQRRAAGPAEAKAVRVLAPAARAGDQGGAYDASVPSQRAGTAPFGSG